MSPLVVVVAKDAQRRYVQVRRSHAPFREARGPQGPHGHLMVLQETSWYCRGPLMGPQWTSWDLSGLHGTSWYLIAPQAPSWYRRGPHGTSARQSPSRSTQTPFLNTFTVDPSIR
ncbi:unnamed protein product [Merluccius merluccius]